MTFNSTRDQLTGARNYSRGMPCRDVGNGRKNIRAEGQFIDAAETCGRAAVDFRQTHIVIRQPTSILKKPPSKPKARIVSIVFLSKHSGRFVIDARRSGEVVDDASSFKRVRIGHRPDLNVAAERPPFHRH